MMARGNEVEGELIDEKVKENFDLAVRLVKSLPQKGSFQPSYTEAAKIYSYFKQAKFGACNIPKPGFWDYINRAKWDAWTSLGSLTREEAMKNYVGEIKVLFVRVKELDDFKEREHEFADQLIPFCQANNISLSQAMLNVSKQQQLISEKQNGSLNADGNKEESLLPANGDFLTENDSECSIPVENGHDHSLLVEKSMPPLKSVKFNLSNDSSKESLSSENGIETNLTMELGAYNNDNHEDKTDDEDEIFCDPIDPSEIQEEGERVTESPLITTDSGVTFNETVIERPSPSKLPPALHESSSTDSLSQEPLLRTLKKPFHRNRSIKQKSPTSKPRYRQNAPRSNKRLEENNGHHQQPNNQSNSNNNHHRSRHPSNSQVALSHTSRVSQNNSTRDPGENPSDSTESYVSSTSNSSNTVGVKIVDALERMENNMQDIIYRLDSIEGTIKTVTKPKTTWWQLYLPSRSMMVWAVWPVIVNIAFFLYWRKIKRQRIKK